MDSTRPARKDTRNICRRVARSEPEIREPAKQLLEENPDFHSRDACAETEMRAETEGQMPSAGAPPAVTEKNLDGDPPKKNLFRNMFIYIG